MPHLHRTLLLLNAVYIIYQLSKGSSICLHYAGGETLCVNVQYTKVSGAEGNGTCEGREGDGETASGDLNLEMNAAAGRCVKSCFVSEAFGEPCRCAQDCIELFGEEGREEMRKERAGWGMGRHGKPIVTTSSSPILKQETDVAIAEGGGGEVSPKHDTDVAVTSWPGDSELMYPKGERIVSCVECWRRCVGKYKWYCRTSKPDIPLIKGGKGEVEVDKEGVRHMIAEWKKDMQHHGSQDLLGDETHLREGDHVILSGRQHAPAGEWTCVDVDSGKLVKTDYMHWNGERRWWSEVVGAE